MNKSELEHVWHSVTSALEKEFWTRGWFSPHAARIEQLEAALRDVANERAYIPPRIRQIARAALEPEQDK
jgi:hypothetical protein